MEGATALSHKRDAKLQLRKEERMKLPLSLSLLLLERFLWHWHWGRGGGEEVNALGGTALNPGLRTLTLVEGLFFGFLRSGCPLSGLQLFPRAPQIIWSFFSSWRKRRIGQMVPFCCFFIF